MNFEGLIIGFLAFFMIGIFHPIVIKAEYYFTKKCWPVFLIVGLVTVYLSTWFSDIYISSALGIFGFSSLWSIHELIEQEQRVKKGWFPANPKHSE